MATTIHLHYVNLYGYEKEKDMKKIQEIMEAMRSNPNSLPAVKIQKINDENYHLLKNSDGGHHRAFASYLAKAPLKVEIVGGSTETVESLLKKGWFNISDTSAGGSGIFVNDQY